MITISNMAVQRIKGNNRCVGRLQTAFDKHAATIMRWIDNKDIRLVSPTALAIIKEETGLVDSEILEEDCKCTAA